MRLPNKADRTYCKRHSEGSHVGIRFLMCMSWRKEGADVASSMEEMVSAEPAH
jgi:hypothetical protein